MPSQYANVMQLSNVHPSLTPRPAPEDDPYTAGRSPAPRPQAAMSGAVGRALFRPAGPPPPPLSLPKPAPPPPAYPPPGLADPALLDTVRGPGSFYTSSMNQSSPEQPYSCAEPGGKQYKYH